MKALVRQNKQVELADIAEPPPPRAGEVRVRVMVSTVNPTDAEMVGGAYDLFLALYRLRGPVKSGLEFAGVVEETSGLYEKGQRIFGYTHLMKGPKTHQQVINVPHSQTAPIPEPLSFEQAASIAIAGNTSIVALDELAGLSPGQSVLIHGASGAVGSFAVQYANHRGVTVTAVAGPGHQDYLRGLGADEVVDYIEQPFSELTGAHDAVLDFATVLRFRDVSHLLKPVGVFIPADPLKTIADFAGNPFRSRKTRYLMVEEGQSEKLSRAAALVADGTISVEIDSRFALADYKSAFERVMSRGRRGRVVLTMANA